tara:strand:- start:36 stop:302 length:267 start_codon:yes stop_codon:yes gene_type:complete
MDPIESIWQAREAANRQAALARILSALETASRDAALTDEDRKIVRYILADAEGDFAPTLRELNDELNKWGDIENYGSAVETPEFARVL